MKKLLNKQSSYRNKITRPYCTCSKCIRLIHLCHGMSLVHFKFCAHTANTRVCMIKCVTNRSHKSHNAPVPCPTMHQSAQKGVHYCSEWCIVGYGRGVLWDCFRSHKSYNRTYLLHSDCRCLQLGQQSTLSPFLTNYRPYTQLHGDNDRNAGVAPEVHSPGPEVDKRGATRAPRSLVGWTSRPSAAQTVCRRRQQNKKGLSFVKKLI